MKLSIAISWQETKFGAIAKGDAPALIDHAKSLGYDAVELAVCNPDAVDAESLLRCLNGMPVSAMGTGQAFLTDGLSFTDGSASVRRSAMERLASHCRLASRIGCPLVIVGLIRGRSGKQHNLVECLRQVCTLAEEVGVRLVIEPINRYETELVNTAEAAMELIDQVGVANLGLLLDTFHMNIEESNPAASLIKCKERLWHVHFADSNRLSPGAGHIDFAQVAGILQALKYGGYISAEIVPKPDAQSAMENALHNMRRSAGTAASTL
jgi:sugar phosphate isomerase/epimerase